MGLVSSKTHAPARVPVALSFTRSQVSSLIATCVDFLTLVFLVEVGRVWYVAATGIGALVGAVTNFNLGRTWSFEAKHARVRSQALRYALVSGMSLVLNLLGVYSLTDFVGIPYQISRLVISFLVGICFNFPLHRSYVFR